MAKWVIFVLFLVSVLGLFAEASPNTTVRVKVQMANVRDSPDIKSSIIMTVKMGTIFEVADKMGPWYVVVLPKTGSGTRSSGYIHESVVEVVEESKEIPPKEEVIEEKPSKPVVQEEKKEETKLLRITPGYLKPERRRGKIGLKLTAGYPMPSSDFFSGSFSFDGGIYLGITNNIAVELTGGMFSYRSLGEPDSLSEGSLKTVAISLSIQGRFFSNKMLVPFIVAGGSYYLNKFSIDSKIVDSWEAVGITITERCENSLAFFGGAGLDFFVANNIALTGDVKYVIAKSKGDWTLADQATDTSVSGDIESIKLGAFVFKAGIRFLF